MIKSNDQETETRILDAARTVFLRQGTAGARMAEIAEEAGVNQALLHYYFRNKAGLAKSVFQRAARQLFPPVLQALASEASIEDKVRTVVEIELDTLLENPLLPGYVLAELNHHPERVEQFVASMTGVSIETVGPRVFDRLGAQIGAAAAAGDLRPIPAEQFVINLLSLCIFPFAARPMLMAVTGMDDGGFRDMIERRKSELPDFFLRGLRP
jgi:AcrR family transcriptional regulator